MRPCILSRVYPPRDSDSAAMERRKDQGEISQSMEMNKDGKMKAI